MGEKGHYKVRMLGSIHVCVSSLCIFLSASRIRVRLPDKIRVLSLCQGERVDALVFLGKESRYITSTMASEVLRGVRSCSCPWQHVLGGSVALLSHQDLDRLTSFMLGERTNW